MNVAMVQACPGESAPADLRHADAWLARARDGGAEVVVFPELFHPGLGALEADEAEVARLAQPIPGPVTEKMADLARRYGLHVVFTLLERGESGCFNSAILLDSAGALVHVHRKTMLTPGLEDRLERGDRYEVADTGLGRVGLLICAEATCPEPARILALKGAELIFLCSGDFVSRWRVDDRDVVECIWESCSASPARAVDNRVFWIAVNASGRNGGLQFFGGSRVISPLGQTLCQLERSVEAQGLGFAHIDRTLIRRLAQAFPLLERRRPELYQELVRHER